MSVVSGSAACGLHGYRIWSCAITFGAAQERDTEAPDGTVFL
jgi:hypothetical protein